MSPHSIRKREHSPHPSSAHSSSAAHSPPSKRRKRESLFDVAAAESRPTSTVEENQAYLDRLYGGAVDAEDSDDAYSNGSQDQSTSRRPGTDARNGNSSNGNDDDSEDEIDWEEVPHRSDDKEEDEPPVSGDLELTLDELPEIPVASAKASGKKAGPTKRQRQVRTSTHRMHVQALLIHNLFRNSWASDKETQRILVDGLPAGIKKEVETWKDRCGRSTTTQLNVAKSEQPGGSKRRRTGHTKSTKQNDKGSTSRDWGSGAQQPIEENPTLHQGDPTIQLLKILTAYWRKRFNITAPGLRKSGWKDARRLASEVRDFQNNSYNPERHGERVRNREHFRHFAKKYEGSRDLGAQLFTALLRGLGIETRMVASLQPIGFGWTKTEEAYPAKPHINNIQSSKTNGTSPGAQKSQSDGQVTKLSTTAKRIQRPKASRTGTSSAPISLSDDSGLSDAPTSESDDSLIDVTPSTPTTSIRKYDRDLQYPHYWTEVLISTHQTWVAVDPLVLGIVAFNDELVAKFEPRGTKAEKAKQVFCYVIAYSTDNTAKDVTTRYLKNHQWPGKTRGFRVAAEKLPIYNNKGKVRGSREYDWFKHVMRLYERPKSKRTKADDIEDGRELVPAKSTREPKSGDEVAMTLQGLKSSAEFVLERHLRREEALLAHAAPVKMFTVGKGEDAQEEPVFLRADVVSCKTVESWHKEGREVKEGEQPLKMVPFRAVTTIRKRELEEAERASGEKMKQGLYSRAQTDWIIPPPIEDGVIPKNTYGNMDVYVPSMVPAGGIHIPLRGTAKICRKLGIDFAEACTGFEFGNRMAVPIITGVVVAIENEDMVIDAWETEEALKREKERKKREKLALTMWKKMISGLRIMDRVKRQYGDKAEEHINDALKKEAHVGRKSKGKAGKDTELGEEKVHSPDNYLTQEVSPSRDFVDENPDPETMFNNEAEEEGGGFLLEDATHDERVQEGGGFIIDDVVDRADDASTTLKSTHRLKPQSTSAPRSLMALHEQHQSFDYPYKDPQKPAEAKENAVNIAIGSRSATDDLQSHTLPGISSDQQNDVPMPPDPVIHDSKSRFRSTQSSKPKRTAAPVRATSRRAAARKSADKLRSHYFNEEEGEDEVEE